MRKLYISLVSNIIVFYFVGLSNIWTQEQALNNKNIYPLQDLGFKLIPYNEDLLYFNDYVLYVLLGITALTIFYQKQYFREIAFRWSIMLNIMFAIRCITIPSTILTRPFNPDEEWKTCKTLDYDYNGLLGPFQMLFLGKMTCFDFIYSGHMSNSVICALIITKYCQYRAIQVLSWLLCVAESYFIISSRSHYLVDIEIAVLLAILIWYVIEYKETISALKNNNEISYV